MGSCDQASGNKKIHNIIEILAEITKEEIKDKIQEDSKFN